MEEHRNGIRGRDKGDAGAGAGAGAGPSPPWHPPTSLSPPHRRATLFEEAEDCLVMSLLMFLFADLRLLSATGRINTRFETLRVESDYAPRTTADEIACRNTRSGIGGRRRRPPRQQQQQQQQRGDRVGRGGRQKVNRYVFNEEEDDVDDNDDNYCYYDNNNDDNDDNDDDDDDDDGGGAGRARNGPIRQLDEGISPAQIMAVLIVELRREVLLQRHKAKERVRHEQERALWGGGNAQSAQGTTGASSKKIIGSGGNDAPPRPSPAAEAADADDEDEETGVLMTLIDRAGRKRLQEDGMNEMLRAYNDMIGKDLKRELPVVKQSALGAWQPPKMRDVLNKVEETRRQLRERMNSARGAAFAATAATAAAVDQSAAVVAAAAGAVKRDGEGDGDNVNKEDRLVKSKQSSELRPESHSEWDQQKQKQKQTASTKRSGAKAAVTIKTAKAPAPATASTELTTTLKALTTTKSAAPPTKKSIFSRSVNRDNGRDEPKESGLEVAILSLDSAEDLDVPSKKFQLALRGGNASRVNGSDQQQQQQQEQQQQQQQQQQQHRQPPLWEKIAQKRQDFDHSWRAVADNVDAFVQESRERRALRRNMQDEVHEYGLAAEKAAAVEEMGEVGDMLFGMAGNVRKKALASIGPGGVGGGGGGGCSGGGGGGGGGGVDGKQGNAGLGDVTEESDDDDDDDDYDVDIVEESGASALVPIVEVSSSVRRSGDERNTAIVKKIGSTLPGERNRTRIYHSWDVGEDAAPSTPPVGNGALSMQRGEPRRTSDYSLFWDPSMNSDKDDGSNNGDDADGIIVVGDEESLQHSGPTSDMMTTTTTSSSSSSSGAAAAEPDTGGSCVVERNSKLHRGSRTASSIASSRALTETELLDHMSRCIESRDYGKLDFMTGFFREGTLSRLMVHSKSRIVWLNDWYPVQDCIYAISVNEEKRRVLVVFRGAITKADWSHSYDAKLKKVPNPVRDAYEKRTDHVKVYRGFYTYLFRRRKDTGTCKWDEIATLVHEYGSSRIGRDYNLVVNGFSLGGALATLFGLYASTDGRFTKNGPVRIFTFGSPYVLSHSFAAAYEHQEMVGKLQHARIYNTRDFVTHLPPNISVLKGSRFRHVGVSVKLYGTLLGRRAPKIFYVRREGPWSSYWRALRNNCVINMPLPWKIRKVHGLAEHLKRLKVAKEVCEKSKDPLLNKSLDEIYELLVLEEKG